MLNSDVYDSSITAVLEEVCQASDLEGLAVLDLSQEEPEFVTSYSAGTGGLNTVDVAIDCWRQIRAVRHTPLPPTSDRSLPAPGCCLRLGPVA